MKSPEVTAEEWPGAEERAKRVAQAIALKAQAKAGGLRFGVYLPPDLADWLLGLVEKGTFVDPSEAVFVMLQEQRELEPHQDLRRELLKRRVQVAIDDPRPGLPPDEVFERLREKSASLPEPAVWETCRPSS